MAELYLAALGYLCSWPHGCCVRAITVVVVGIRPWGRGRCGRRRGASVDGQRVQQGPPTHTARAGDAVHSLTRHVPNKAGGEWVWVGGWWRRWSRAGWVEHMHPVQAIFYLIARTRAQKDSPRCIVVASAGNAQRRGCPPVRPPQPWHSSLSYGPHSLRL